MRPFLERVVSPPFLMSVSIQASFLNSSDAAPVVACRIRPSTDPTCVRRNFHVAFCLDKSGSMGGPRIEGLKTTLQLFLDAIPNGDVVTFIPYDNKSTVLAEAVVISDVSRASLKTAIDGLEANGGTNLEAALLLLREAVSQKKDVETQAFLHPPIDSLFILTDGEINEGVSASSGLQRLIRGAVPAGTPVNTLGLGEACSARLLRALAEPNRGVYTYADKGEVFPKMVGEVMAGLASEVGRNGRLALPAGWTCLELGEHTTDALVGTLVDGKDEWVVLRGPTSGATQTLTFTWSSGGVAQTATCAIDDALPAVTVAEQLARVRVAAVFQAVTEHLEERRIEEARTQLTALNVELGASLAKDTSSVLSFMAQVDENLELLRDQFVAGNFAGPQGPMIRRAGAGGPIPPPPDLAPVLSRMHSNTSAVSTQRGFFSRVSSNDPGVVTFSSPLQANTSRTMSSQYSQARDPDHVSPPSSPVSPVRRQLGTHTPRTDLATGTTTAFPVVASPSTVNHIDTTIVATPEPATFNATPPVSS